MQGLPPPSAQFISKKDKILNLLAVPDTEYSDASPKGSVDVGIRKLIEEVNAIDGLVTTSSCAGRVSVFVEGNKSLEDTGEAGDSQQQQQQQQQQQIASAVGGKGGGGNWLLVSHDPVPEDGDWIDSLQMSVRAKGNDLNGGDVDHMPSKRLIHFKFEPMILHVLTASPAHAQLILRCALEAGFRESGAVNLISTSDEQPSPMVGIRSMGLGFESLIGYQMGDRREQIVNTAYLRTILSIANERFVENTKRIERFRAALRSVATARSSASRKNQDGEVWEDAAARCERKRAEGLRRQAELRKEPNENLISPNEEQFAIAKSLSGF